MTKFNVKITNNSSKKLEIDELNNFIKIKIIDIFGKTSNLINQYNLFSENNEIILETKNYENKFMQLFFFIYEYKNNYYRMKLEEI